MSSGPWSAPRLPLLNQGVSKRMLLKGFLKGFSYATIGLLVTGLVVTMKGSVSILMSM